MEMIISRLVLIFSYTAAGELSDHIVKLWSMQISAVTNFTLFQAKAIYVLHTEPRQKLSIVFIVK